MPDRTPDRAPDGGATGTPDDPAGRSGDPAGPAPGPADRTRGGPRDSTSAEVAAVCTAAGDAADRLADLEAYPLGTRAALLRAVAGALDDDTDGLVTTADEETGLGRARLTGELARTTGQLRLFADLVDDGDFLDVRIDPADDGASPPRPELRRMNHPIGPVAVYTASNFPFAFSVAGGDTAAALAAGCPVVVKAHPGHPRTADRTADLVAEALSPLLAGAFALVHGFEAGAALVAEPAIRAAAFTGSRRGGRALFDLAAARPDPIPFYGELGSVNPVFVTPAAARARAAEIAAGHLASFTLGSGQFCTKPGLLFLPRGHSLADRIRDMIDEAGGTDRRRLLTDEIAAAYAAGIRDLAARPEVTALAGDGPAATETAATEPAGVGPADTAGSGERRRTDAAYPSGSGPLVYAVAARDLTPPLWEECFGPVSLIVEYDSAEELAAAAASMPGSLTATIHAEPGEALAAELLAAVRRRAGRVIWNGWPTGVAVTAAMHHGGPWPATTAPLHTSVGTAAIRRFLVPVAYQNAPAELLPPPLRAG